MTTMTDNDLVVFLAAGSAGCSLNTSPGKNWVEKEGGLPNYICRIARAVMKSGKSRSSAIAIAVSRAKKWAAGGDKVNADTRAKAAKAVAEWEALKAKAKGGKVVKATNDLDQDYIFLSNINSFNTDLVREAWSDLQRTLRNAAREQYVAEHPGQNMPYDLEVPYNYVKELWTDFIIVQVDGYGNSGELVKVPYEVNDGTVTFHDPVKVVQQYQEVPDDDDDEDLSDEEKELLGDLLVLSPERSMLDKIMALNAKK